MVGVVGEHGAQDVEGEAFVAVLLAVQRGDREVDAGVEPLGLPGHDIGKRLLRGGVFVLPHQSHAAVVGGASVVGDPVLLDGA